MQTQQFKIQDKKLLKEQLLLFCSEFKYSVYLDNNDYQSPTNNFEVLAGFDAKRVIASKSFDELIKFQQHNKTWLLGYLSYDLKNDTEQLTSKNYDGLLFPQLQFFEPKNVLQIKGNTLIVIADEPDVLYKKIRATKPVYEKTEPIKVTQRTTKAQYLKKINTLLQHIKRGDIFEINYCHEFYNDQVKTNPVTLFHHLNTTSATPFASFVKMNDCFAICASPERFLSKQHNTITSQPIKGTQKRGATLHEDEQIKKALAANKKEQSENVMIVDLVRNDLSRIATKGSVKVKELFGIYTFPQVHQMISSITCEVPFTANPVDIIKNCFPMGSMTGAPKVKAMELIEQYEDMKRGLYSGSIGYFTPEDDFDFNVVIRSILYNATTQYLSFCVGGAITSKSNPADEFTETLLKAKAIFKVLN